MRRKIERVLHSRAAQDRLGPGRAVTVACETPSATVLDVRYPAAAEYDTHEHTRDYLCLAVYGAYREWSIRGSSGVVTAGQDLVYREGSRHAVRICSRAFRMVHVADPDGAGWEGPLAPTATGILWQVARAVADRQQRDAEVLHMATLVGELRPPDERADIGNWLGRVRERLRDGFRDTITLAQLARDVGRHPSHVARAFKARWGLSAGEYLRRVRVAAAIGQVRDTDDPPSLIALETGFADQSHLTRWMRRYAGVTPGALRRSPGRRRARCS